MLRPQMVNEIPVVSAEDVLKNLDGGLQLIDVRRPEEFNDNLGHIKGARLVTLGPELMEFFKTLSPQANIVFVCRSGGRSGQATALSRQFGLTQTMNMTGGMLRWNELGFTVER